jgi:hypothetical protein
MRATSYCAAFFMVLLLAAHALGQKATATPAPPAKAAASSSASGSAQSDGEGSSQASWSASLVVSGYIIPDQDGYASPVFTAAHRRLHLEARYNYENLRTGSAWIGYNFTAGKQLELSVTPMIGGVFGRTNGVAPGCEASLTYKKIELSVSNEYVFDTGAKAGNFYYSWPQLTYSLKDWLRLGLVAQRSKAFQTKLDTQRGFLVGFNHKKAEFTTYIFNAGWTTPTVVLEAGWSF